MYRRIISLALILCVLTGASVAETASSPTPGYPAGSLHNGVVDASEGSPVVELQERLIALGLLAGKADGHFGGGTEAAVKLFQQMYGLAPTGAADQNTRAALSVAQIGVTEIQDKLIAVGVKTGAPDGVLGPATTDAISLFQQMYGLPATGVADPETRSLLFSEPNLVYGIQTKPSQLTYLSGASDGVIGAATTTAVREFQQTHGLAATGVADPATRDLLLNGTGLIPKPTPTPTPRAKGASGADIELAQEKLAVWGFLDGTIDGSYGDATEKAVKAFKSYQYEDYLAYLEANPTPSPAPSFAPTRAATPTLRPGELPRVVDATIAPTPSPTPSPTPYVPNPVIEDELLYYLRDGSFKVYRQTVEVGDSGREVRRVQRRLGQLGYLYNGADGTYGEITANALKYFQRRNNLDQTGVADEATQLALFDPSAVRSTEYVFPYKLVVDVSDQRVYVYRWTGEGYGERLHSFKCSTGTKSDPTPLGTYQAGGPAGGRWYYFKDFDCYAQYATRIFGGILFHSVIYGQPKESSLQRSSVSNLGRRASHGCIRLTVDNAKWIYSNCPVGTTVVIQN